MQLVLASRSPQRRAILEQLGVPFTVLVADADELADGPDPAAVAVENARRKALAAAGVVNRASHGPAAAHASAILGVDTVVVLDGRIYGKPADAAQARATLELLAGRTHEVVSGVAVVEPAGAGGGAGGARGEAGGAPGGGAMGVSCGASTSSAEAGGGAQAGIVGPQPRVRTASATTRVTFCALDARTLDWYLATGEWRERAGAYAIQGRGAALVERIEGDYLNVVGLPVATLLRLLPELVG